MIRRLTQAGQTIHSVHDLWGNRIAEYLFDDVAQTSSLIREYIWMDGTLVGVFEGGTLYYVRTDHIGRPSFATDSTGAIAWSATYLPFGGIHTSTGSNSDLRFPGQWFQSESGLHQNWMRDYNPTLGRYIQADPLGLVDGASVYGYALQNPGRYIDPRGEFGVVGAIGGGAINLGVQLAVGMIWGQMSLRQSLLCVDVGKVVMSAWLGAMGATASKAWKSGAGAARSAGVAGVGFFANQEVPEARLGDMFGLECECEVEDVPEWLRSLVL